MKKSRMLFNLLVVFSMVFALVAAAPTQFATAGDIEEPDRPDRSVSGLDIVAMVEELSREDAINKIDPGLRESAQAGGKDVVDVFVSVRNGADISKFVTDAYARPQIFPGLITYFARASVGNLLPLAQHADVVAITDARIMEYQLPVDEDTAAPLNAAERLAALREIDLSYAEAQAKANELGSQGWWDVGDGHQSSDAWDKGFDGEGVRVGVLDDGIDFAHPDLMGTYATVTDEDSPYYGWPMAFSQVSLTYFFYDLFFGVDLIASGGNGSRWVDTQTTTGAFPVPFPGDPATGSFNYQPLGASGAFEYTFGLTSQSGYYKFGSHPDRNLNAFYGNRVAVLVVDENVAGVYDTVYVDLDNDASFLDEKPVTKDDPHVYRDMDGDGYTDISGGILTWISDGANIPPAADFLWGIDCSWSSPTMEGCPASGELLNFAGPFDTGYTHGTQCASNIAGQGVVDGGLTDQPFRVGGMVQGGAPNVGLVDFGNHYYSGTDEDEFLVAALGYDGIPNSGDEIQITSNSYGNFRQMWGSFGYFGRLITALNMSVAPTTVWLFSAGNEGPGYGPQEGDGGPTTIQVGSSTQYGSTNWDSIVSADQIVFGDPNSFFSKGPNRDGTSGLDVLANGGRGAGDEGINYYGFNGAESWATWGGTSRSSPVAAGNLALVYQAYKERYNEWPTWDVAKALFKSGATNSVSSPFFQGAGVVNADRATDLAAGIYGVYATPDEWQVGNWEGVEYLNFAKVAMPGNVYTKTYTVYNPSGYDIDVDLSDGVMLKTGEYEYTFTTSDQSEESNFNFHSPDYLMEVPTNTIPVDAELMVVRYVHPYDTFDPAYDFTANPNSSWRMMVYNWTDVNGDGMLWDDADANGVVNHVDDLALGPDNDGFLRPDYNDPGTEIQEGEYVRMDYEFGGLAIPVMIHDPAERMADGYFFGFQHRYNDGSVDQTTFTIGVEFYSRADFAWLTLSDSSLPVPAEGTAAFVATATIPSDAAPGAYEGVIYMNDPGDGHHDAHESALPVVVNVIADLPDDGAALLGGNAMEDTLYQNSWTNGYFNWYGGGWTGAGDWRHYFMNLDDADIENQNLLIHTSWMDGYPTDINTWLLGPTSDCASNGADPCAWFQPDPDYGQPDQEVFGPYTLQPIGWNEPFLSGAAYPFNTATGGPDDWIIAPVTDAGLYEVALHNVLYSGENLAAQFQVDVGTINMEPEIDPLVGAVSAGSVMVDVYTDTGSLEMNFTPTIALPDMVASLSGGLQTVHTNYTTTLTDSEECGDGAACADTTWTVVPVDEPGTTELVVYIPMPAGEDIDLFVYLDANANGVWDSGVDVLKGTSTNGAGTDDFVTLASPELGDYLVGILGWDLSVPTLDADWYTEETFPGPLPTDPVEVFSNTVSIDQDTAGDYTSASYSMTVTADERAQNLNIALTDIITGSNVDVYVTDGLGAVVASSTNTGNADEMAMVVPSGANYRLGEGAEYTIWVLGEAVTGTITPHLQVWWDELNVWLSATHPDVHVAAIGAGETVSVTLHFAKEGWLVGDPDLSARFTAGPSFLPEAFDELVTLDRANAPEAPTMFDPDNLAVNYTVETARGPSPFIRWTVGGVPVSTALGSGGEEAIWTIEVTNNDPFSATLEFEAEVDNWTQIFLAGDTPTNEYYTQTFDSIVITPTLGTCFYDPVWLWVQWDVTLQPGESATCAFQTITDPDLILDHLSALWEVNYAGLVTAADVYRRSFRTTGSYKEVDKMVVAPGEPFTYTLSLYNPSAFDETVHLVDALPAEVDLISADAALIYDPISHTLTWDGVLPGTSLSSIDMNVMVEAKAGLTDGQMIENEFDLFVLPDLDVPWATYGTYNEVDLGEISVTKTVDRLVAGPGGSLAYTILVENPGIEDAVNVVVTDTLPASVTISETTITGGAVYAGGVLSWTGDVTAGGSHTITFEATVNDDVHNELAIINGALAASDNYPTVKWNSALTEIFNYIVTLPFIAR